MSLKNISRDIISKADIEKEKISKELKVVMSEKETESQKRIDLFKSDYKEKFDLEEQVLVQKIKGTYERESKRIILDAKSKIISQIKEDSLNNIKKLEGKDRENFLNKLIKIAKSQINYEVIYCSAKDLKYIKSKNSSKKIKSKDIEGLIFESENGEEILDLTFEVIAQHIFEENEDKIQEMVF